MNLKQFAKLLNLSPTTVSRALNGYPEVSEATRQKVRAAAEKHQYRPSHHAKTLAGGATQSIGHIVTRNSAQLIDPHFADFIAGASEIYSQHGYDLNLVIVDKDKEEENYLNYIRTRRVDGLMIQSPTADDRRIALLHDSGMPFVVHGRSDAQGEDYSWVDVNNRRAFRRATDFLLELGHKKIALINGDETLNFAKRRRTGYVEALLAKALPVDEALCFADAMTEAYGYQTASQALSLPKTQRPTALLIASALPALGAYRAITEHNLRQPEDISVIIYDDCLSFLRGEDGQIPLFTAVRSSIFEHGKQAAKQLIAQINAPDTSPVQTLWDAELVIGKSTGVVPHD